MCIKRKILKVEVCCNGCGKKYLKEKSKIKSWSGLCLTCSSKVALKAIGIRIGKDHPLWVEPIKCIDCGIEIKDKTRRSTQKRCIKCYHKARNASYCKICNKKLLHSNSKYCQKCFPETMRGEKSSSWVGGLPNCKLCGNKLSVYKNAKDFNTGICRKCMTAENHPRWNPLLNNSDRGLTRTRQPNYRKWRNAVFERDNFICVKCGDDKGGNLQAHHIDNYATNLEGRFSINNGITFCVKCHQEFHKIYGLKNNDAIQLMDFFGVETNLINN